MTRSSSVLAEIVASRGLQAEPVATDALVHLLGRSPEGRQAMGSVLNEIAPDAHSGPLTFRAQVVDGGDEGRPDLVGADSDHGNRLVIEAKFDAELTPAQRSTRYLNRISRSAPSALMFLVPEERLGAVWPEILAGPGQIASRPEFVDPSVAANDILTHRLDDGTTLAAYTWRLLLRRLRTAMERAGEQDNLEDLAQIEGLVAWRSRVDWTPVLPGDLPVRTGRQLAALIPALLRAAETFSAAKVTGGSGDAGAGRYVTTAAGERLWVGVWFSWWANLGVSPCWVQVKGRKGLSVDLVVSSLHKAQIPCFGRAQQNDVLVPVLVPMGVELAKVEHGIVDTLRRVEAVVDQLRTAAPYPRTEPPATEVSESAVTSSGTSSAE